jgi:ribosome-binding protein aMBF1 (putative translation factor)
MELKKSKGEHLGNAPYGWRKHENILVEDEYEQKIIAEVREMRNRGWSLAEIARQLKKKKYLTRAGNSQWQKTQIARILHRVANVE